MKQLAKAIFILLALATMISSAQPSTEGRTSRKTQEQGYWIDPSTKLMWPARESDKALTWRKAKNYCRDLRSEGNSDWRLPTLDELATLVDNDPAATKQLGDAEITAISLGWHVRGGLSLAGDAWSSNREKDRFGHDYGDGHFFDFRQGKPSYDLPYFRNVKYALCVRRSTN
jgi:hypothetical protein